MAQETLVTHSGVMEASGLQEPEGKKPAKAQFRRLADGKVFADVAIWDAEKFKLLKTGGQWDVLMSEKSKEYNGRTYLNLALQTLNRPAGNDGLEEPFSNYPSLPFEEEELPEKESPEAERTLKPNPLYLTDFEWTKNLLITSQTALELATKRATELEVVDSEPWDSKRWINCVAWHRRQFMLMHYGEFTQFELSE